MARNTTNDRKPSGADRPQTRTLTEAELDAVSGSGTLDAAVKSGWDAKAATKK